jgi:hypothetical protein
MAASDDYLAIHAGLNMDQAIERYFKLGFTQLEILAFLCKYHNLNIGLRTLQRILHTKGLRRKANDSDIIDVINAIDDELSSDLGKDLGYRAMHQRVTVRRNIITNRENVRKILTFIDPGGVDARRRRRLRRREYRVKGPNYLWHIDGWDKLKAYGLCVHGCIDGFSRRILWIKVAATNHDPFVICSYFANFCKTVHGIPHKIRADCGTENVNVEMMQPVLRTLYSTNGQEEACFLYGKSTNNQRIEAWWSKFKQLGMHTWIEHFKDLVDVGVVDTSSELDIQCIRFCYMALLSNQLAEIRQLWNIHYIRKSRNCCSPSGKPDMMYFMPDAYDTCDYLKPYITDDMEHVEGILCNDAPLCDDIYGELFTILVQEGNKDMPHSLEEADDLLVYLLDAAQFELDHASQ